jgi:hypothetical protein
MVRGLRNDIPRQTDVLTAKALEYDAVKATLAGNGQEMETVNAQLRYAEVAVSNLEAQRGDRLQAFGRGIKLIMDDINRTRWEHSKPIGPLGMHVKLLDMTYKDAMHSLMGGLLCGFAVRTARDRQTLMEIFRKRGNA